MKRMTLVAAITVSILSPLAAQAGWEEGVAAFQAGRYQDAVREFEAVSSQSPEWPGGHLMLGRALLKLDKAQQAIAALRKAYDLEPGSAQTKMVLAQAYLEANRYQDAAGLLKTLDVGKLEPAQRATYHQLQAAAMNGSGQSDGAVEALRKAAAANPNDGNLQYQLGTIALANQDSSTAVAALEKAARLKAGDADVLKAYVKALLLKGRESRDAEKQASYRKAIEIAQQLVAKSGSYDNVLTLGEAQLGAKAYRDAVATFERAKGMKAGEWLPSFYIGQGQTALEQYSQAEATLNTALRGATGEAQRQITRQLAFVYEKQKKYDEAIAAYRRIGDQGGVTRVESNKRTEAENAAIQEQNELLKQLEEEQKQLQQQMKQVPPG